MDELVNDSAHTRIERLRSEPLLPVASGGGFLAAVRAVFAHRQLLALLIRRDITARYKDRVLGLLWTLLNQLVQLPVSFLVMGPSLGAAGGIPDSGTHIFLVLTI